MGNFFEDLVEDGKKTISDATGGADPMDVIADAFVNSITAGLVGYDSKSGIKKGIVTRGWDEAIGEVGGRNQARAAIADAKVALDAEAAAKKTELANEAKRKEQQDVAASNYAGAARATASAQQQNNSLGLSGGDISSDFLGL